jgi:hypothetical protein
MAFFMVRVAIKDASRGEAMGWLKMWVRFWN